MKRLLHTLMLACLAAPAAMAQSEGYVPTPVTISKEKTRNAAGEVCYSHVVLERQTLFSIAKAYGVSIEAICEANKALNLDTEGLKKNQIILIPAADQKKADEPVQEPEEYIIHTVKWFEDLNAIAAKYGVPADVIMQVNGLKSATVSRRQQLRIPMNYTASAENPAAAAVDDRQDQKNVVNDIRETIEDIFSFGRKSQVTASLILPLDAKGQAAENPYDFYCGALLAVRDLEAEGLNVKLNVYDCAHGAMPVTGDALRESSLVIGPISTADITRAMEKFPSNTYIVSPLEPKASSLAASSPNIIQLPSAAEMQARELISWMLEEKAPNDNVILVTEKGVALNGNAALLKARMDSLHVTYSSISYGILEGRDIISRFEKLASPEGITRIVVASESEAFVNDVIRNINLLNVRKHDAIAYCLAKARNFDTIDIDQMHNTRMHVCTQYHVDYENTRVMDFLMAYRALFNSEPSPFSYQGYDSTYQMIKSCAEGGAHWTDRLTSSREHGLQTDFRFSRSASGSLVNTAVRRVIYDEGYEIRLAN